MRVYKRPPLPYSKFGHGLINLMFYAVTRSFSPHSAAHALLALDIVCHILNTHMVYHNPCRECDLPTDDFVNNIIMPQIMNGTLLERLYRIVCSGYFCRGNILRIARTCSKQNFPCVPILCKRYNPL